MRVPQGWTFLLTAGVVTMVWAVAVLVVPLTSSVTMFWRCSLLWSVLAASRSSSEIWVLSSTVTVRCLPPRRPGVVWASSW